MKDLVGHIDALILEYDCVIIPGFGGFVLNRESASLGEVILPPKVTIGFNPALKHNDGLLAESYMNSESISYDVACKLINEAVKKINAFLSARQSVNFPRLGVFTTNEESQIVFTPVKKVFLHPATLGYSAISMKRLTDIVATEQATIKATKKVGLRRAFTGVAAVAAAVLVFFVASTPVQDVSSDEVQRSGFFTDKIATNKLVVEEESVILNKIEKTPAIDTESVIVESIVEHQEPIKIIESPKEQIVEKVKEPKYYIIVGSGPTQKSAEGLVSKLKAKGFGESVVVASSEKIRVAVASFKDRTEAERYLDKLRINNHQYSDAWLLVKRR